MPPILNPRVGGESSPHLAATTTDVSGLVELPRDRGEDEARCLGRLAAELLALVLLERNREVREHRLERGRASQRPTVERRLESRNRCPGVVDGVTLRVHQ